MKPSEQNVLLGLVAIAALLYFSRQANADQGNYSGGGDGQGGGGGTFVPGGADGGSGGVTGSWLMYKDPIL